MTVWNLPLVGRPVRLSLRMASMVVPSPTRPALWVRLRRLSTMLDSRMSDVLGLTAGGACGMSGTSAGRSAELSSRANALGIAGLGGDRSGAVEEPRTMSL